MNEVTKICNTCMIEKSTDEFYKDKTKWDGFIPQCKKCIKEYRLANHEKIKKQNRDSYHKHNNDRKETMKSNYRRNKETRKLQAQEYREKNKEYYREYFKQYRQTEKRKKYNNDWRRNEYHNNPAFKLNDKMAGGINRSLKGSKNRISWEKLVGYSMLELKIHLEKQFTKGMTWEKYMNGEIHIDHIIPKSIFNITGPNSKGFKKAWALENLRPMWAKDNMKKYNKLFAA